MLSLSSTAVCTMVLMWMLCFSPLLSAQVPLQWTCDPSRYNASDGCDCACGLQDPDCNVLPVANYTVPRGCNCFGQVCSGGWCSGSCGESNETRYLLSQVKVYRVVVVIVIILFYLMSFWVCALVVIRYRDEGVIELARELQIPILKEKMRNANNEALQKMYPDTHESFFQKATTKIRSALKKSQTVTDEEEMQQLQSPESI